MIKYKNPQIYISTLLPVGKSGIESLNRFVGAHKRYTSATEFGSVGEVKHKEDGTFTMQNHGILLSPVSFDFCSYLKANIAEYSAKDKKYGLSIYKNGLSVLGININKNISVDKLKQLSGQLSYKITDCVLPVLNEGQQSLVSALLQTKDLSSSWTKIASYSLAVSEESPFESTDPQEILKNHSAQIEAYTDWVISSHKLDEGLLFIGMSGILYLGKRNPNIDKCLKLLLFLKSCNKISHQLHTLLWSVRKKLHELKVCSKNGNYRILKKINDDICSLNDTLSKIKIYDNFLRDETILISQQWKESKEINDSLKNFIFPQFNDEADKSLERDNTIKQLIKEFEILGSELENRLELIMTKDSMTLNTILLALTVISALSIGEVVGFNQKQWVVVAIVIIVFGIISFSYLKNMLKIFYKH